jgi:hypothetical protein
MREAFKNRLVIQKKRVEEGIIDVFYCFAENISCGTSNITKRLGTLEDKVKKYFTSETTT